MSLVRLRLLGPLQLVVDGRSVDLGGPRHRIVLSLLALNANRLVSTDRLVDAVWGTSPPSTARTQIQICISALRKLFAAADLQDALQTRPPGYILRVSDDSLDSEHFTGLVADARIHLHEGRNVEAADLLRAALALWRGPALADIPSELLQREAAVLNDRRSAATEERIRVELELGQHRELIGELRAMVSEQPLREELSALLMLALYRSGRQAEALEVCRRTRGMLVEEVGIEPGAELQHLEHAILNRDPALNVPTFDRELLPLAGQRPASNPPAAAPKTSEYQVTPRQLPASIGDFTGREDPLVVIKQVLGGEQVPTASHAMPIVAISGKGGVGKSTLAVRVAHELSDGFPDGHLFAGLGVTSNEVGEDRTAMVLARFLHALGVNGAAVPGDLQERIELYRSRVAGKRLLVVLDDVTDEEQARPLLPGSPTCAVIMTSRRRLTGLSGTYRIDLEVFEVDKSLELLGKIIGVDRLATEHDAAVELVNRCGGLPLALRIAGARLASRKHWRIRTLVQRLGDEAHQLDELSHHRLELRSNIGLTYRALDEHAKRLFRLFALIRAPDFPGWTAAALLDTNLIDAENIMESLVDAQILDAVSYPGAPSPRYRFHDLIRVYAREQLMQVETEDSQRQALSRLLGAWLGLAERAHRIEYGGDYTILHGTAPRWQLPEHNVAELLANPREWWEAESRTLMAMTRQAAAEGLDELCWDLALTLVTLFEAKGLFDDWRETSLEAYDLATRKGNRLGRAAMLYSLGTLHVYQKRLVEAEHAFAEASDLFTAEGNQHGYALAVRNSALVDRLRGDFDAMLDKYARALELMRALGDRIGEAHILCSLAKHRIDEGEFDVAEQLLDQASTICREERCSRVEAQVLYRSAEVYLGTGKIELARQSLHRVLRHVRNLGDRIGEAYTLYGMGVLRLREGRLSHAETTLVHTLGLARRIGERLVEGQTLYTLSELELVKGDSVAAGRRLAEATAVFEELGSRLWRAKACLLHSRLYVIAGDTGSAVQQLAGADALLARVHSKESLQLRAQLAEQRSALLDRSPVAGVDLAQP